MSISIRNKLELMHVYGEGESINSNSLGSSKGDCFVLAYCIFEIYKSCTIKCSVRICVSSVLSNIRISSSIDTIKLNG